MMALDQCPFCGSNETVLNHAGRGNYAAFCLDCLAVGPAHGGMIQAINAWNQATRLELLKFELPPST
jgi:Lar family restriction alleviation protein